MIRASGLIVSVILAGSVLTSSAQDYPVRDIKVLSGQPAGSGADVIVRFFSDMLRRRLQHTVFVENRPGILGSLAGEALARAAPDGYTILISGYPAVSSNWVLFSKLPYDPVKQFAPVTTVASQPFVLVVNPKSQISTVQELTTYLKTKSTRGSYGSSNSSGLGLSELYKSAASLRTTYIPYRSVAEVLRDLLTGEIDFAFFDSGFAVTQIRSGSVRGLAVSSAQRSLVFPDLPTMVESNVPEAKLASWFAVFVPANTPAQIIQRLYLSFSEILKLDETKRFLGGLGIDVMPGTPESLARLQAEEIERWRHIMKIANIAPQ